MSAVVVLIPEDVRFPTVEQLPESSFAFAVLSAERATFRILWEGRESVVESIEAMGGGKRSLFDALNERGMIGAFDGPGDLSTNPKHMEGFGEPRYGTDSD